MIMLREAAKKRYLFSGPATKRGRGGVKGLATKKTKNFLLNISICYENINSGLFDISYIIQTTLKTFREFLSVFLCVNFYLEP